MGEGVAVRPGQQAHCPRCRHQERGGRAGTGRNRDSLTVCSVAAFPPPLPGRYISSQCETSTVDIFECKDDI